MITHTGKLHQAFFPSVEWRMSTPGVYLTFDDGPHLSATEEVLRTLDRHKAPATFFLLGENVVGRESIVQRIADEGHTIGLHGYHHSRLPALSQEKTLEEIRRSETAIRSITPRFKKIYRPPYGFFCWPGLKAAKKLDYRVILWSVLTGDFKRWNESKVISTALNALSDGSVLVFHDNELTTGKIGSMVSECILRIRDAGFQLHAI